MGDRLDKLKRMQVAAVQDELPLVVALKWHGINARRNSSANGYMNRTEGDVIFDVNDHVYSVECQVVGEEKRYDNFSYGADKVELYRGACGAYDNAYTLLGCYEKKGGKDMIFMLLPAKVLHGFLENLKDEDFGHGVFLNEGVPTRGKASNKYYTVSPENLAGLDGTVIGSSIEEVVRLWVGDAFPKPKTICMFCNTESDRLGKACSSCQEDYKQDPEAFK